MCHLEALQDTVLSNKQQVRKTLVFNGAAVHMEESFKCSCLFVCLFNLYAAHTTQRSLGGLQQLKHNKR